MTGYLEWLRGVRDSKLPARAKLVAYTLATYMNFETGDCFPSRETIATAIGGADKSTVTRAVRQLVDAGWIERKRRMNASNVYRRTMPDETNVSRRDETPDETAWYADDVPFDTDLDLPF